MKKAILNGYALNGYTVHSNLPIGTVIPSFANTTPVGFLNCDHTKIKKSDYPELWDRLKNVPMCQSEETEYFFTPDLREVSLVGIGENGTLDISAHDIYDVGQFKDDQLQGHGHTFQQEGGDAPANVPINSKIIFGASQQGALNNTNAISIDSVQGARVGTTTHGKQVGVRWIIKATQYATVEQNAIDDTKFTTGNVLSAQKTKELTEEIYSDEEVIIGYLIQNGVKIPIYRRLITATYNTTSNAWGLVCNDDLSFIKRILRAEQSRETYFINPIVERRTDGKFYAYSASGTSIGDLFTLEYTKTTD